MGESSIISCTLCRQSTKTPGKAVLAKNLFRYAKNLPVFLTLHSKDFLNAVRSIADEIERLNNEIIENWGSYSVFCCMPSSQRTASFL